MMCAIKRCLRDPLFWIAATLVIATLGMPATGPLFHALYPDLPRPVYVRADFTTLVMAHIGLVAASSVVLGLCGVGIGVFVTRPMGRDFRRLVDVLTAVGQTFPPVAVLALAVPAVGYGAWPTLIALVCYGILPVVESTIAGLGGVPATLREAADGTGFTPLMRLWKIELPLALPTLLAGLRTAVIINIGTATIGSTVGALSLGSPIIEGLSGSNPAYVIQGAVLVGLLAVTVDLMFERTATAIKRYQGTLSAA
jgi:osmoprotectant transport system permease protein